MRKDAGESGPRSGTGALLKQQNHICLNQLNSSRHVKGKILLDVSETSWRLKVKYSCGSIELKMEEYLRF